MKIFDLTGHQSKKVIVIEDDEMLEWNVIKIQDYELRKMVQEAKDGARPQLASVSKKRTGN